MKKLVLASNNSGKLREFGALLQPLGWEVVPQAALNVPEADEPYGTFVENALTKARHAARITGLPALADDSGICVRALGGAPGVHSARFAGEPKSDERNNALLLEKLTGVADRRAHYVAVLVWLRSADDPQPIICEGEWHGEVLTAPRGSGGFGYDPLFWLPQLEQSAGEIDATLKNAVSHRALACRELLERLQREA
ncbi:RdgB/HAM1 family non-canonical purine NTP pyrophosphatase [Uliginosibacterium sp. H1]|uniref:RdgB/HAM1 family non-canonical purine NTP pyrophosphatase n=1 Tax=Uliginosibacterium sp. H1 TaxID=3114757 RepID=UPI002E17DB61|nr:RdgB/HAM1 family non-canonical purine NTP pyrophosphatase [Uliginosibacterium sp. H1]